MPLIQDPVSKLMEHVLGFQNVRHDVIASNIANSNTPGFKAFDIHLRQQIGAGEQLVPLTSNPRHLMMGEDLMRSGAEIVRSREPSRLDGNNVNLDVQLMKLMENRTMYSVAMELKDRWGNLKPVARDVNR